MGKEGDGDKEGGREKRGNERKKGKKGEKKESENLPSFLWIMGGGRRILIPVKYIPLTRQLRSTTVPKGPAYTDSTEKKIANRGRNWEKYFLGESVL